ncbi:MAG: hypothetical protein ABI548_19395 [Polyangiaceae bacterium]
MRHVPYFFRLSSGLLLTGLAGLGCSSSTTDVTTILRPELVAVSPEDFLGTLALSCGTGPGQVQSYVATLFDVTPADDGGPTPVFQLASSPPTSCRSPVTFGYVVTNHRYIAQIDAYDHPTPDQADAGEPSAADAGAAGAGGSSALGSEANKGAAPTTPIIPTALGSRLMQDPNNMRVTPHWNFTCGGYAPARVDGGANTSGGAGSVNEGTDQDAAGEAGQAARTAFDNPLVGVLTYDNLTQTVHDCRVGLQMIAQ